MGKGICVAGNMIVDCMYPCETYPKEGNLTHIFEGISKATGGAVCNTGVDICKLDPNCKVMLAGVAGHDENGDYMLEQLKAYPNADLSQVSRNGDTSFTLVLNNVESKARTFFTYGGAGNYYGEDYIDWNNLDVDIFHIGYILLLPHLDEENAEYGTNMAKLLHRVQEMGIKTSIDVVSESGDRFKKLVTPALKYTDYCIINEIEAQQTTGVLLRDENDVLHTENFKEALTKLKEIGVSTWAVIHCPEIGAGLDENGNYFELPSLVLPKGFIQGSTGAGDAFCAGVLYAAEEGKSLLEALKIGACTAAASLTDVSATKGVGTLDEVLKLYDLYGKKEN